MWNKNIKYVLALIIELIVIGKFNKEYMISTDRYSSDVWYLNI